MNKKKVLVLVRTGLTGSSNNNNITLRYKIIIQIREHTKSNFFLEISMTYSSVIVH